MRRLLKWIGYTLATLAVLGLLAIALVYVISQRSLDKEYDAPLEPVAISSSPEVIAEGKRLAITRGCFDGCHGKGVSGAVLFDEPWVGRAIAPNLTRVAADYSDSELERVIRRGIRKNGKSVWAMPSSEYYHLNDSDLAALIAFLRSLPASEGPDYELELRILGRIGLVAGQFRPVAERIKQGPPRFEVTDPESPAQLGNYLALTMCADCHGKHFQGGSFGGAPNLVVIKSYDADAFRRLIREGISVDGREDLGMMSEVSTRHLHLLRDDEIDALHAFFIQYVPPVASEGN